MKKVTKNLKNNKGQGVMEYIILTSLIGIFCLMTVKNIGGKLKDKLEKIESRIDKKIKFK